MDRRRYRRNCDWLLYRGQNTAAKECLGDKFERTVHFTKSYWLATLLGGTHGLLAVAAVVIQLLSVWDDMNPTMIVVATRIGSELLGLSLM